MIRRTRGLVLVAVTTMLIGLAGPTVAQARHTNSDWVGVTDQGGYVKMRIIRTEPGGPRLISLFQLLITFVCDDGSEETTQFGFGGHDFPIRHGDGEFQVGDFAWTGHFSHEHASGTAQYQTENCDSGMVTWTAEHQHPPG